MSARWCYNVRHVQSHFYIGKQNADYTLCPLPVTLDEYWYLYNKMADLGDIDSSGCFILDKDEVRTVGILFLKELRGELY